MTRQIKLEAQERGEEKGGRKIIAEGFIPAVIYGSNREPQSLKVKRADFERIFALAGESNLIALTADGKESVKVIVKDIQKEPVKDKIIHIDFYQVDMNKKIIAEIPLHFIGEARAVKELGGVLVKGADAIEVKCLPGDLADHINVDLSALNTFYDSIRMRDLKLPAGMEFTSETDEMLVHVVEPKVEEIKVAEAPIAGEGGVAAEAQGEEAGGKEGKEGSKEVKK